MRPDDFAPDHAAELPPNARRLLKLLEQFRPRMASPAFRRLQELQISPSHIGVLGILNDGRPLAMKDLADRLKITPPSITALTRRLVQARLVERQPYPDDSRVTLVAITAEGRELFQQLHAAHVGRMHQFLAGLTPEEQTQFLDLFEKAVRYANADQPAHHCGVSNPETGPTTEGQELDSDPT